MPRAVPVTVSVPVARPAPTPATPYAVSCSSPTAPMPTILPHSSCSGRSVDSSSSTTRDDFSSTTPIATYMPNIMICMYSSTTAAIARVVRCPCSGSGGSSASTVTVARAVSAASADGSTPRAVRASTWACCATAVSIVARRAGSISDSATAVTEPPGPGISATSSSPSRTRSRPSPASGTSETSTELPVASPIALIVAPSAGSPTTPTVAASSSPANSDTATMPPTMASRTIALLIRKLFLRTWVRNSRRATRATAWTGLSGALTRPPPLGTGRSASGDGRRIRARDRWRGRPGGSAGRRRPSRAAERCGHRRGRRW